MGSQLVLPEMCLDLSYHTPWSRQVRFESGVDFVKTFDMYGCAIVAGDLETSVLLGLASHMLSSETYSMRENGRYSTNSWKNKEDKSYAAFLDSAVLQTSLDMLAEAGCSSRYQLGPLANWEYGLAGGDVCPPFCMEAQPLHTDWASMPLAYMNMGYAIAVSVSPTHVTAEYGPICIIPWNLEKHHDKNGKYHVQHRASDFLITLSPGEFLIRDVRACHGGSINRLGAPRPLPGVQVLSPLYLQSL